jgi:hypothetical protein
MKKVNSLLAAIAFCGLATIPALADSKDASSGISAPQAAVARSATVQITITTTLSTSFPSTTAIICNATLNHQGFAGAFYFEQITEVATRSGASATCTMTIPFRWAAADTVNFINISGSVAIIRAPSTTLPGAGGLISRSTNVPFTSIPLPGQNATVNISKTARM